MSLTAGHATRSPRTDAGAIIAVYVVALVLLPSRYTLDVYALTVAMLVSAIGGLLWFALFTQSPGTQLTRAPAGRGLLIFLCLTLVSYFVATVQPIASGAVGGADRRLVGLLGAIAIALLALDGIRSRRALDGVIGALVVAGAIIATIGIVQYLSRHELATSLRPPGFSSGGPVSFIYSRAGHRRVAGTARHPIEFGIVCAMLLPFALHLANYARRAVARRWSLVAAVLMAVALPMALSRAAVLAVAAALVVLVPAWTPSRRLRTLVGSVLTLWLLSAITPGLLSAMWGLFFGDTAGGSDEARAQSAELSLDLFASSPMLGQGLGTVQGFIIDNQYLATLVESGIVGMIALVLLLNGAVRSARMARRATDDPALRHLAHSLVAVVVAFAVAGTGLATLVFPMTSGLLLLVVGLAGALHTVVRSAATDVEPTAVESAEGSTVGEHRVPDGRAAI